MNNAYVFWRRIFSFIIDTIILMAVGYLLCRVFYNQFLAMGNWATLVGFILFVLYYGLQNSFLCKGQTVGDRIFKIKIISENGQHLTIKQSILRSVLLTPILIFNNLILPQGYMSTAKFVIVIILNVIQVILFLVNTPSRQLLHDLITKSVCVNKNAEIQNVEKKVIKLVLSIGIPTVLGFIAFIPICNFESKTFGLSMQEMSNLYKELKQNTDAKLVGIQARYNKNIETNKTTSTINYVVDIPNVDVKDTKLFDESAAKVFSVLLKYSEKIKEVDFIGISLLKSVNIGISYYNYNYSKFGTLQEWLKLFESNNTEQQTE